MKSKSILSLLLITLVFALQTQGVTLANSMSSRYYYPTLDYSERHLICHSYLPANQTLAVLSSSVDNDNVRLRLNRKGQKSVFEAYHGDRYLPQVRRGEAFEAKLFDKDYFTNDQQKSSVLEIVSSKLNALALRHINITYKDSYFELFCRPYYEVSFTGLELPSRDIDFISDEINTKCFEAFEEGYIVEFSRFIYTHTNINKTSFYGLEFNVIENSTNEKISRFSFYYNKEESGKYHLADVLGTHCLTTEKEE